MFNCSSFIAPNEVSPQATADKCFQIFCIYPGVRANWMYVHWIWTLNPAVGVYLLYKTIVDSSTQSIYTSLEILVMFLMNILMILRTQKNISWCWGLSSFFLIRIHSSIFSNFFPVIIPPRKGGVTEYFYLLYRK